MPDSGADNVAIIESTDGEARVMQGIINGIGFIGGRAVPRQGISAPGALFSDALVIKHAGRRTGRMLND